MENCVLTSNYAEAAAGILNAGTAVLKNCLLTGLTTDSEQYAGGIASYGSTTLVSCTLSGCGRGWSGGALYGGGFTLTNCLITNCGAGGGGGLYVGGSNFLYGCTISGNGATEFGEGAGGGAIANFGNTVVVNCTLSGNRIDVSGGAINNSGNLWMTNCTVSGSTLILYGYPGQAAAGILNNSGANLYLTDCTIVSNTAPAGYSDGLQNNGAATNIYATDCIFANNGTNEILGAITSQGYNLIKVTNGCTLTGTLTGNIYGVDPLLGPLQNNGGLTPTYALLPGSPAIDAGPANAAPNFDERGLPRPQGAADDIGAYEFGATPPPAVVGLSCLGNGTFALQCVGVPGYTYSILRAPSPSGPWSPVFNASADGTGYGICIDSNAPAGSAFYRAASPSQ